MLFPERREHASGVVVQNTGENSTVYTISTQAQARRDEDASRDLSEAVFAQQSSLYIKVPKFPENVLLIFYMRLRQCPLSLTVHILLFAAVTIIGSIDGDTERCQSHL